MEPSTRPLPRHSGSISKPPVLPAAPPPLPMPQPPASEGDMGQIFDAAKRRWYVVAGVAVLFLTFMLRSALSVRTEYEGQFRLLVEPVNTDNNLSEIAQTGSRPPTSGLDYDTQIQILRSPELLSKSIEELQTFYPDLSYGRLASNLTIGRPEDTKILAVSYRGNNLAEVQAVLDQLSQDYLDYSLEERQTNLRQGIQYVNKQLPEIQDRVNDLQNQLQTFRQENKFIDPDAQTAQVSEQAVTLEQQLFTIDQQLLEARSRLSLLVEQEGTTAALNNAPLYQELLGQLREIESQISIELTRFQDDSVTIRTLRQQRENLLPLIRQEARRVLGSTNAELVTQIQLLEVQRKAIIDAQASLEQDLQELPVLSRYYADLQRELEVSTESLNRFLSARETLQIEASQTEIPWQLIDPPITQISKARDLNKSLMLGILGGIGLGIAAAVMLDKLDGNEHSIPQMKGKVPFPLLGIIPAPSEVPGQVQVLPTSVPRLKILRGPVKFWTRVSPQLKRWFFSMIGYEVNDELSFIEAVRLLQTSVVNLGYQQPIRSIIVSSIGPGDGKTAIAVQLAYAAAEMGQRVLLVDADLRSPQVHEQLRLQNEKGLSNLLSVDLRLKNVIHNPDPILDFYVLTAGELPSNPIRVLSHQKLPHLMSKFQQTFDLVIYDAPYLTGLADATLLAPQTDGMLLVTRVGSTKRADLTRSIESLRLAQFPVLGYVINKE